MRWPNTTQDMQDSWCKSFNRKGTRSHQQAGGLTCLQEAFSSEFKCYQKGRLKGLKESPGPWLKLYANCIRDLLRKQPQRWSQLFPLFFFSATGGGNKYFYIILVSLLSSQEETPQYFRHESRILGLSPDNLFSTSAVFLFFSTLQIHYLTPPDSATHSNDDILLLLPLFCPHY